MAWLWRAGAKFSLVASAVGGGVTTALIATSDDPETALKLCATVPHRLFRDAVTAANIAFDYEYSLWGLPEGSIERERIKHEVHLRSAQKLQDLCFKNGGVYIKLGQHLGQLEYLVPQEYVQTMRESMLNKCPVSSYEQVCNVFKKELGDTPDKIFSEFDPVPIASASLAQVHVARMHDGQKVAVKVQHTHMTDTAAADHATVELVVNTLHRFFPSFDYRWLIDEISESLPKELDFLTEAKNSERCLGNFHKLSPHIANYVYAPKVYWNLSTSKLLTMEFMDGAYVNDVKTIQKLGINLHELSTLVSQTFAEMMFKHGFVHCDPHAANLLVRPLPSSKASIWGRRKPQLILLDHGLYKELDFQTRTNYASLWKGLVFADANAIKEYSAKLGAGEDLYALFAGVLTMRPWNRVVDPSMDHLVIQGNESERLELQMYASQYFHQISELLRRLPRVILLMLKTNDCLRAVNNSLLQGSSLETFFIIGKVSSEAVIEAKMLKSKSLLTWLNVKLDKILLEVRLWGMQVALWLLQLRKALSWSNQPF
ncbi:putative ABC1 protein At2g40090 isoform X1 [Vigna radiata var. radiata]|uniref:ABC1 protein At2g40090 isoform X1 n=1 Tax=Vigna radiata var. radiata TaxID=3916 RepID=A0A1S3TN08_VIGRR|nr:putative ABC1 protein At2g40090 isoform X1 [Vigna radiata var. radiata]